MLFPVFGGSFEQGFKRTKVTIQVLTGILTSMRIINYNTESNLKQEYGVNKKKMKDPGASYPYSQSVPEL